MCDVGGNFVCGVAGVCVGHVGVSGGCVGGVSVGGRCVGRVAQRVRARTGVRARARV